MRVFQRTFLFWKFWGENSSIAVWRKNNPRMAQIRTKRPNARTFEFSVELSVDGIVGSLSFRTKVSHRSAKIDLLLYRSLLRGLSLSEHEAIDFRLFVGVGRGLSLRRQFRHHLLQPPTLLPQSLICLTVQFFLLVNLIL